MHRKGSINYVLSTLNWNWDCTRLVHLIKYPRLFLKKNGVHLAYIKMTVIVYPFDLAVDDALELS